MPPSLRTPLQFLVLTCALLGPASQSAQANRAPKLVRFRTMPSDVHANNEEHFEGFKRSLMVRFEVDEQGAVRNAKIKRTSGSRVADDIALARFAGSTNHGQDVALYKFQALATIDFSAPASTNP